ncbi:MAG: class I SAM-dependent methyltransferase [candidate division KSB1 bacterium]|nr:class I SAM-dependent methyltransferase [candidate division KSB1 bacterium]
MKRSTRTENEIIHGQVLAARGAEDIWGWGSPAGRVRADRRAALIAEAAQLQPKNRVLEIGCGTGVFTERFAAFGCDIVAVDLSEDLLEIARKRPLSATQVCFLCKPFEECEIEGPFDAVVGSSILHHLDLQTALPKIFTLLKAGGRIAFAEPNMLNPQICAQKNIPWLKRWLGDSPDETAFVRWALANTLRKVGFVEVRISPFDWLHPLVPSLLIGVVSRVGRVFERIPVIREFSGSLLIFARKPS